MGRVRSCYLKAKRKGLMLAVGADVIECSHDAMSRERVPTPRLAAAVVVVALCSSLGSSLAGAQEPPKPAEASAEDLAKQAQNPIANLISVPFQNNNGFNFGPRKRTLNVLNIQPVVPFRLSDDWNLITRTIVPIIHLPSLAKGDSSENGIGDINPTAFFATSLAKDVLVGFGPTFTLPTASHTDLGTGKERRASRGHRLDSGSLGRGRAHQQSVVVRR